MWKKFTTYTVLKRLCDKGIFKNENGSFSSIIYTDDNIPIFGVSNDKLNLYTSDRSMITVHSSMYDIGELKKVRYAV